MTRVKIKSNPYTREISYLTMDESTGDWADVKETDENSRLRETDSERAFLPFRIREIINIILNEYYIGQKISLEFEGTQDEFAELASVCVSDDLKDKVELIRTHTILENARFIKDDIKEIFEKVEPIIRNIIKEDDSVIRGLKKVSRALDDVIPLCVFGNYSSGKSTFINALIGRELLPSGGDPVTAKIYAIRNSDQLDHAKIGFLFHEEKFELSFEGDEFRVLHGNADADVIREIRSEIACEESCDLFGLVRVSLEILNSYEKKDREIAEIGNVVSVAVPFSDTGIIGQSANKFVIFDTPGSNSNSNQDHAKVLAEALADFSNGIPLWLTEYDAHDTKDNAALCDKILAIDSLDRRFTMIIFNKADDADLPEKGFSERQIQEILQYKAVEKMYASGIFFVSSIMGLGGKNQDTMVDHFYRKTFRMQLPAFSDPEDMDYTALYRYNIMPEQIKKNAMACSAQCGNLVYANSGFYCVEREIENFAGKYSAYNKCQMVFSFLSHVVEKTSSRIDEMMKVLDGARDKVSRELDEKTKALQSEIVCTAGDIGKKNKQASEQDIRDYVNQNLNYQFEIEQLANLDASRRKQNFEENNFRLTEEGFQEAKDKLLDHLRESGQGLFQQNLVDSVKVLAENLSNDLKKIQNTKARMDSTERELDKLSSEQILQYIIDQYKRSIDDAQEKIEDHLDEYWREKEAELKRTLIHRITESSVLSDTQREEIENIIQQYDVSNFRNQADTVFVRKRFLRGTLFGLRIGDDERLDTERLARSYNDTISNSIDEMSQEMNRECIGKFQIWTEQLLAEINANLTEYNPELKVLAETIRVENETIMGLKSSQQMIGASLSAIKDLMSWKVLEGE